MSNPKDKIREVIFGTDTPLGKIFDIVLIITIILSVVLVMIDSITSYSKNYSDIIINLEWFFTLIFTIEFILRLYVSKKPSVYLFSFFGFIDFFSIIPTYISLFFPGAQVLSIIRVLRVLRIFRVLKLAQYIGEADMLIKALLASRRKILIFLFLLMNIVIVLGSMMYLIEGETSGFDSIPRSIYWAIVTITTVGYGDISPQTSIGQTLSSLIMIIGYSIIAVPTGIVTSEIKFVNDNFKKHICDSCEQGSIQLDDQYCSMCGSKVNW